MVRFLKGESLAASETSAVDVIAIVVVIMLVRDAESLAVPPPRDVESFCPPAISKLGWPGIPAVSFTSLHAPSASSECVRSRVTEAGCASRATRRPLSGARNFGSAMSRSIPNFMIGYAGASLSAKQWE